MFIEVILCLLTPPGVAFLLSRSTDHSGSEVSRTLVWWYIWVNCWERERAFGWGWMCFANSRCRFGVWAHNKIEHTSNQLKSSILLFLVVGPGRQRQWLVLPPGIWWELSWCCWSLILVQKGKGNKHCIPSGFYLLQTCAGPDHTAQNPEVMCVSPALFKGISIPGVLHQLCFLHSFYLFFQSVSEPWGGEIWSRLGLNIPRSLNQCISPGCESLYLSLSAAKGGFSDDGWARCWSVSTVECYDGSFYC